MPVKGRYQSVPQPLSDEDKEFVRLVNTGMARTKAFRIAYPNNEGVKRYLDIVKNGGDPDERYKASRNVIELSKSKVQTKKIRAAMIEYQERMDVFSDKSLETAIDLVENASSEKVRATLAIEGMRQRVGTPVQKVKVQEEKEVHITFGPPHRDDIIDGEETSPYSDIQEAEVV